MNIREYVAGIESDDKKIEFLSLELIAVQKSILKTKKEYHEKMSNDIRKLEIIEELFNEVQKSQSIEEKHMNSQPTGKTVRKTKSIISDDLFKF